MPIKETKSQQGEEPQTPPVPDHLYSANKVLPAAVLVLAVLAIGSAAAAYNYRSKVEELKKDPQKVAQQESQAMLQAVGKLIVLPTDEQPTIATVADPDKLKDQAFFANAHKGDKVLIYTKARKAILFDPTAGKIIEVAPVSIGNAPVPQTAGATTEE